MVKVILAEIEHNLEMIRNDRREIADLKEKKINTRSNAWADATGTAKEKEDFVRARVSAYDKEIAYLESNIEYLYNKNSLLNDKLVFIENE